MEFVGFVGFVEFVEFVGFVECRASEKLIDFAHLRVSSPDLDNMTVGLVRFIGFVGFIGFVEFVGFFEFMEFVEPHLVLLKNR